MLRGNTGEPCTRSMVVHNADPNACCCPRFFARYGCDAHRPQRADPCRCGCRACACACRPERYTSFDLEPPTVATSVWHPAGDCCGCGAWCRRSLSPTGLCAPFFSRSIGGHRRALGWPPAEVRYLEAANRSDADHADHPHLEQERSALNELCGERISTGADHQFR